MSPGDEAVSRLLDELERMLAAEVPDGEALAAWRRSFDAAASAAERGPSWDAVLRRAKALGAQLQMKLAGLERRKAEVEAELRAQDQGARALRGYGSVLKG